MKAQESLAMPFDYARLRAALAAEPLPALLVDLDALEDNARRLAATARAAGKSLRVASKSVRVPALLRRLLDGGEGALRGLLCYSVAEAAFLHGLGFDDLLVAYPSSEPRDLDLLFALRRAGARICVMVDHLGQVDVLREGWGRRLGESGPGSTTALTLPLCIDVDVSFRPLRRFPRVADRLHLGVQRSPIRDIESLQALIRTIRETPQLVLRGVMAYEAHVAGIGERNPFTPAQNPVKRALKAAAVPDVATRRRAVAKALASEGYRLGDGPGEILFNGGGTGSLRTTCAEPWITEVTAGSGFLQSHLFDYFEENRCAPALFFALRVTRIPQPGIVTCQGGGFIASGSIGQDRAPRVVLPQGLTPLSAEGFGEVQTPLRLPPGLHLSIGDPILCRPAKAGEIAERFQEVLLLRDHRVVDRVPTYRGLGQCFH